MPAKLVRDEHRVRNHATVLPSCTLGGREVLPLVPLNANRLYGRPTRPNRGKTILTSAEQRGILFGLSVTHHTPSVKFDLPCVREIVREIGTCFFCVQRAEYSTRHLQFEPGKQSGTVPLRTRLSLISHREP